ncbi:nicotinate phosphoribosyltransferase [Alkalihalobacillus sp. MEB130]|uniref:nicotinate phosphoribosyltransferase n=1 Tax=Alkalihalobacillus sp. MEB130 TaxID=2976704 RepID=UPI0028DFAE96|nr:nicotinate phosphoribosyltransferase [Alkalihalobacillus sp. MEB130]MDT8859666.1 nicotinate phosphoribosyltransferase [Alkalihalobacillus sp. MEB130]
MKNYNDDSLALHTDAYQINMTETYWHDNMHNRKAVFELYFRKMPFGNGYGVFAGLERIIEYIKEFRFTESDIEYLRNAVGYEEEFLSYLKTIRFTGTIRSMREGELVFGNEPILQVESTLAEAQLIETALLNIVNYQTLIATKASRIKQVIGNEKALEFGSRRAQEMDAAIWGTRAAFIAGFDSTSNVRAGKKFGIPVSGTHAHSMIQVYKSDYIAMKKYAESCMKRGNKVFIPLVDTYDVLRSGVPAAIRVAKEFKGQVDFKGIRLDGGDMAYLSKKTRELLDEAGFESTQIVASSDLDEQTILSLKAQGAKIDVWGIGTKLITAFDQPALGAVYKIVAIEDDQGKMVDTIKISSNPEKVTTPGQKRVYRIINNKNGKSEGDYIALKEEEPQKEERLKMFHPTHTFISKFVSDFEARELLTDIFVEGELVYKSPDIYSIQQFAAENVNVLWEEYTRTLNPEEYPVDLSQKCWDNKMSIIKNIKAEIKGRIEG